MMKKRGSLCLLVCALVAFAHTPHAAAGTTTSPSAVDVGSLFGKRSGAFVLYDLQRNAYVRHNEKRCRQRFSPHSTFKIPNSLIGLETGVIRDAEYRIAWNREKYPPHTNWNTEPFKHWGRDHTLRTAIRYSVLWYYRELALRVGRERMREHLSRLSYGNGDVSSPIDEFWLGGRSLKISADEQVKFLKRLYKSELPVSRRSMEIVRDIIVLEETPQYRLSGKTGGGPRADGGSMGWFVGYVEASGNVAFFATQLDGPDFASIREERINLTRRILSDMGYLPKQ